MPDADGARGRPDAVALLAMAGARQAASPTAQAQARLPTARPRTGSAFAGTVAMSIAEWNG
ncbi:hypothetical protein [Sphingomonas bacterium]|uniref:hypothetical protein n=1 Tax=Sphingomonas bacterium TaxID=1895847 RepID=UPI0015758274|nr:hypothetical protein [Sphingomonas bacterium]